MDASLLSQIARGLYARINGRLSLNVSGYRIFSKSWAQEFMRRHKFRVRKATGDRTVSASHIVEVGKHFYETIGEIKSYNTRLIFNVDEFFCHLGTGANNTQQWTWERVSASKTQNVVIRTQKLGFTCSVLTNCYGEVVLFQIIWKGKTSAVHARPSPQQFPGHRDHPSVYQTNRPDSHFQSEHTWRDCLEHFKVEVRRIRMELGMVCAPAALLVDAAGQHNCTEEMLKDTGIRSIEIPRKCTHVFQPADMYVISCIKIQAKLGWNRYIQQVYTEHPEGEATQIITEAVVEVFLRSPHYNK